MYCFTLFNCWQWLIQPLIIVSVVPGVTFQVTHSLSCSQYAHELTCLMHAKDEKPSMRRAKNFSSRPPWWIENFIENLWKKVFLNLAFCIREEMRNNSSSKSSSSGTFLKSWTIIYLLHASLVSRPEGQIPFAWTHPVSKNTKDDKSVRRETVIERMKGEWVSERTQIFIICVFAHVNYRNKIIKVTVGVLKGFSASILFFWEKRKLCSG